MENRHGSMEAPGEYKGRSMGLRVGCVEEGREKQVGLVNEGQPGV